MSILTGAHKYLYKVVNNKRQSQLETDPCTNCDGNIMPFNFSLWSLLYNAILLLE